MGMRIWTVEHELPWTMRLRNDRTDAASTLAVAPERQERSTEASVCRATESLQNFQARQMEDRTMILLRVSNITVRSQAMQVIC